MLGHPSLMRNASRGVVLRRRRTSYRAVAASASGAADNHHGINLFSTSATQQQQQQQDVEPNKKQKRLARTLYRQLLRWCQATEPDIPLSAFIEPVSLAPPQVDSEKLEALKQLQDSGRDNNSNNDDNYSSTVIEQAHRLLPPRSSIGSETLLVAVRDAEELRNLIRSMYRLNSSIVPPVHTKDNENEPPNDNNNKNSVADLQKTRVSFAFQTLRTLNELSTSLDDLNEHRANHMDRSVNINNSNDDNNDDSNQDVKYHVGQVVQHKQERWRGVIVGWEKPEETFNQHDKNDDTMPKQLTSLTTKTYTASDFLNSTRYEVILDAGDVHMMQATSSFIVSTQDDLQPVTDARLCRIRSNMINENFRGFDAKSNTFILNDMLAYEYPIDHTIQQQASEGHDAYSSTNMQQGQDIEPAGTLPAVKETEQLANDVMAQVKDLAAKLASCIALPEDHRERQGLRLLWAFQKRLFVIANGLEQDSSMHGVYNLHGNALPPLEEKQTPVASACAHLRQLLNIALEVRDILFHRQTSQEASSKLKFTLGEVVYHKVFGFRGVIVGFDQKPTVDVSRWDGVQHIDDPLEMPFYHISPDQSDCVEIFGAERGMRYVCQDNLEACYRNRSAVTVSHLDSDWTRSANAEGTTFFEAPPEIKFKHGIDIDDGVTERCLIKVQDEITNWQVQSRDAPESNPYPQLPFHKLFELLKATEKLDDAIAIEETIKEIWKAHPSQCLRGQLDNGITDVLRGKGKEALETFKDLATKDQHYAEAWNKIAACEYMLGNMQESLDAAEKALELTPTHFQALNGVGLCHFDDGKYELAAESFKRSIDLDPWSPVSSKLAACYDVLHKRNEGEDKRK